MFIIFCMLWMFCIQNIQAKKHVKNIQFALQTSEKLNFSKKSQDNSFRKAWLYAAILPGLGQVYNKKYWKVPILYVFLAGLGWGIYDQHQKYFTFRRALFQEQATGKNDLSLNIDQLRHQTEVYRKDRDWLILCIGLLYIINILDAHVDAHLYTFDLSDDLALQVKPAVHLLPHKKSGVGLSFVLHRKVCV